MSGPFINVPQVPFPGSLDIVSKLAPEVAREKPPPSIKAEPGKPVPDMEFVYPHPQPAEFAHLNRHPVGDEADESRAEHLLGHPAPMPELDRMVEAQPDLQANTKSTAHAAGKAQGLTPAVNEGPAGEDTPSAYVESGFGSDAGQ